MKIVTWVLVAVCVIWVCIASFVPLSHPPLLDFWTAGAIKDADEIIAHSGTNILDGTPLTVSRGTLMMLTIRAKTPDDSARTAQFLRWASVGFATVAGVSLFLLGKKHAYEND